jgi:predicted ribosomally synthesized peptide with nif11-like leader
MSLESAKAFLERMKADYEFKKRVTEASPAEARKAIVEKEGFDFTKEEIGSVISQLSHEELEVVAGDWMCWIGCLTTIKEFAFECISYSSAGNTKKDDT